MANQKLKTLLQKAQSGSRTIPYKKMFITANGTEYRFRPLSTLLIDPKEVPFIKVRLHGGYKHPNFEGSFASNYRCLGKDCPMCVDVKAIKNVEYTNNLSRELRTAWKKDKSQYAILWAINLDNNELTLVMIQDTDRFKKMKDEKTGKDEWKKINTTCQEIVFNKLMTAAENGLDPFDYDAGNDIVIKSKKVDNVVHWDVSVINEKNSVPAEIREKLKNVPKLEDLYKKYTKEELEYIVKGKPFNKDLTKQKVAEVKESTEEKVSDISNETFEEDSSDSDEAALLGDDSSFEDDDSYSDLSDSLRDILNKS
jgi:hypothetical protein